VRVLLRVSTKDTLPSTDSMIATSPGAPTWSVPSFAARLITLAGLLVAMATTCSSVKPSPMNLLMTQGRYGIPGVLPENTWISEEMVWGVQPCAIAGSATV
jgi:hypothetical protein